MGPNHIARRPLVGALGLLAIAGSGAAQGLVWRDAAAPGVDDCRMVFDTLRSRFVAVGAPGALAAVTTVEWDGVVWRRRPTASTPSPRTDFGLAFDELRGRVVLFGGESRGQTSGTRLDDTWEYDGAEWTARSTSPRPPRRSQAAMTWDPLRGVVLLAGGSGAADVTTTDAWSWNGNAWQQLPGSVPPLTGPEIAWHPSSGRIVMIGNRLQAAETWTFDGTTWSATGASTPYGLVYRATTDEAGDRVVLMAAENLLPHTWNGTAWTPMARSLDGRRRCGLAADRSGNTITFAGQIVFGVGFGGLLLPRNDTWRLATAAHQALDFGGPVEITGMELAFDVGRQRVVAVGTAASTSLQNDAWEFDGSTWRAVGPAVPPARIDARMCYDVLRARTVRFGGGFPGFLSILPTNELSEWDGAQWITRGGFQPPARRSHSMVYDLAHGAVFMFGGVGAGGVALGDTWTWDGANWTQRTGSGPSPRAEASIAADLVRGRVVLFGGSDFAAILGDTWEWDGTGWIQRQTGLSPAPRRMAAMGFDISSARTVLTAGVDNARVFDDQWQWNGFQWQQLVGTASPSRMLSSTLLFDGGGRAIAASSAGTWFGHPFAATSTVAGTGCGGAFVPALRTEGDPVIGAAFRATLHRATPARAFALGIGIGRASLLLGGGCTFYLPQLDVLMQGATASGYAEVPLAVPPIAALAGLEVSLQVGVLDGSAPLGLALSNAIVARLGL